MSGEALHAPQEPPPKLPTDTPQTLSGHTQLGEHSFIEGVIIGGAHFVGERLGIWVGVLAVAALASLGVWVRRRLGKNQKPSEPVSAVPALRAEKPEPAGQPF